MKKRRILLALIMLIITGISLTTATYAWFTANRAVSVEEIDVKASASGGIQISADAKSWSNEVTLAQLKNVNPEADITLDNHFPETATMQPVTTIGTNGQTGKFVFFSGELNDAGDQVKTAAIDDTSKLYAAFDLYFYSIKPQKIEFNEGTGVIAKGVGGGTVVDKDLKSSVRVGFLFQGNDNTATPATARGLHKGTLADQQIWEPNADKHSKNAVDFGGVTQNHVETTMGGKAASDDAFVSKTDGEKFEAIGSTHHLITSNEGAYPEGVIFDFAEGINKVRVYVWLEGQDVDNEDSVTLGSGVGVKLNFKTQEAQG